MKTLAVTMGGFFLAACLTGAAVCGWALPRAAGGTWLLWTFGLMCLFQAAAWIKIIVDEVRR